ncbi:Hypothetical protein SMAX5B_001328 [Scophthalmus maximus]|uniref:Uncharacterized protein n=1 Tax=Scophthalmus maximus TaxID=52904 RepID=A0A2U9CVB8_SCOMX|nr:Hypothetical protein SMAX5B_001328 [Scophthalmus maximus]
MEPKRLKLTECTTLVILSRGSVSCHCLSPWQQYPTYVKIQPGNSRLPKSCLSKSRGSKCQKLSPRAQKALHEQQSCLSHPREQALVSLKGFKSARDD